MIELRDKYFRDKNWCYWWLSPHDFRDCESAILPAWRIQNSTNSVSIDSRKADNYVYASTASDAFYQVALAKINACSHIEMLQD